MSRPRVKVTARARAQRAARYHRSLRRR